jgi:hypothetical protein
MSMADCFLLVGKFGSTAVSLYSTQLYEPPPKTPEALTEDPVAGVLPLVPVPVLPAVVPLVPLLALGPLFPLVLLSVNPPELADPVFVPDAVWSDLLIIFPAKLLFPLGHSLALDWSKSGVCTIISPINVDPPGSMFKLNTPLSAVLS